MVQFWIRCARIANAAIVLPAGDPGKEVAMRHADPEAKNGGRTRENATSDGQILAGHFNNRQCEQQSSQEDYFFPRIYLFAPQQKIRMEKIFKALTAKIKLSLSRQCRRHRLRERAKSYDKT